MANDPTRTRHLSDAYRPSAKTASATCKLRSGSGLSFLLLETGAIQSIRSPEVPITLYQGSALEGSPANLYLRTIRDGAVQAWIPLLGAGATGCVSFTENAMTAQGTLADVAFRLTLLPGCGSDWEWRVELSNPGVDSVTCDVVCVQDVGMSNAGNEAYISQYVDHTILQHEELGPVLCARQNMPQQGKHPWLMLGCRSGVISFATDGLDFFGLSHRATRRPEALDRATLAGRRRQGEFSLMALQARPGAIGPGETHHVGFFGVFVDDHPEPTAEEDLNRVPALAVAGDGSRAMAEAGEPGTPMGSSGSLYATAPVLMSEELTESAVAEIWPRPWTQTERGSEDRLLSFFTADRRHIVLQAKECIQERRTGAILRSGKGLVGEERLLSLTSTMQGAFVSHLAVGNLSLNVGLSIRRDPLGVLLDGGLRVWVEREDGWAMLGLPSAFENAFNGCRWRYVFGAELIDLRVWTETEQHAAHLELRSSQPRRFRLAAGIVMGPCGTQPELSDVLEVTPDRIVLRPTPGTPFCEHDAQAHLTISPWTGTDIEMIGDDGMLFQDGGSRGTPTLVLDTVSTKHFGLSFAGSLAGGARDGATGESAPDFDAMTAKGNAAYAELAGELHLDADDPAVDRLNAVLPWFLHNAVIHLSAPHGLEQYLGAAWGTRDICQGPAELLLALGRTQEVRNILCTVFANQHADGHWPQWFMYDNHADIRAGDAHGDVVFWPLKALADYVTATGDLSILEDIQPYHQAPDCMETVAEHVSRALDHIRAASVPGTSLVAYGHGDWNDSLQPVDSHLAKRMVSSWTVQLSYQVLTALHDVWTAAGRDNAAMELTELTDAIRRDFREILLQEGTVCGFAVLEEDRTVRPLLHPADQETGIHFRLLPMVRGILSEIFTREEANRHADLIAEHLLCPDGARLMDRPPRYSGGRQRIFQRGETATFFGREIGIMYVHAHIRYLEAMARLGRADALFDGLMAIIPPGLRETVPNAELRQNNCFFSSSDAAFLDRYEADRDYDRVKTGTIPVKGGWRIYSSGSGLTISLLIRYLFGLRQERGDLVVDPVLPQRLDGLCVRWRLHGHDVTVCYELEERTAPPRRISLNGADLPADRLDAPYRLAGLRIARRELETRLIAGRNRMVVRM